MTFIKIGDVLVNLELVAVMDYDPFITQQNQVLPHGKLRISGGGGAAEVNVDLATFQAIAAYVRGDRPAFAGTDDIRS